jgi:hypothetical protein
VDNNDGLGSVDYTAALLRDTPLTITRRRGEWTVCHAGLDLLGTGLPAPTLRARVLVLGAAGGVLFRGFVEGEPRATASTASTTGMQEQPVLRALEEDWLTHAVPGDVLQPSTAAQHTVALQEVALRYDVSSLAADLATDVTVTGAHEAAAYVTELFRGDGATQTFALSHAPFREEADATLVAEQFDDSVLNAAMWSRTDPGGYLSLGSGGLSMMGGTSVDGATVLAFAPLVEMGGTLVAEAKGLMLSVGSDGLLLGFYDATVASAHCVAGVRVRGEAGAHALVAVVNGVEQTTSYDFAAGHSYAVRVRLHCAEVQRVRTRYRALVDGVLQSFGGDTVDAPLQIVIEVVDQGLASSTLPTALYDGAIAVSPAQCVFAPVNSRSLMGSVASVGLMQSGSAWVVSTATDGTRITRRAGAVGTGADYALSAAGMLTFNPGRLPQPGELVTVRYRRSKRAAARRKDAATDLLRAELALPGLPQGNVHVFRPAARSSADCVAAAQALLALATGSATGVAGSATWFRGVALDVDVQPGDTLLLQSASGTQRLTVQSVVMTDGNCMPELLRYTATFAQSRARSLDFEVGGGLADDVVMPIAASAAGTALPASLAGLQVAIATDTALQIDSGIDPPVGGGFEVRRSDGHFGASSTADLVLNSPVRSFSIPRLAFAERFHVRMYDGSAPRRYSPVSSVVLTSLPVS